MPQILHGPLVHLHASLLSWSGVTGYTRSQPRRMVYRWSASQFRWFYSYYSRKDDFYKLFLNEIGTYFCTYSAHSTHGINRILPSKCLRTKQNAISSCNMSSIGNKYLQIRLVLRTVQVYRPSRTAFATSVASARVGRRLSIMLSTTLVMITGLPAMLHLWIPVFWDMKTWRAKSGRLWNEATKNYRKSTGI